MYHTFIDYATSGGKMPEYVAVSIIAIVALLLIVSCAIAWGDK
jgi:hypothetical protein